MASSGYGVYERAKETGYIGGQKRAGGKGRQRHRFDMSGVKAEAGKKAKAAAKSANKYDSY